MYSKGLMSSQKDLRENWLLNERQKRVHSDGLLLSDDDFSFTEESETLVTMHLPTGSLSVVSDDDLQGP
jgi:hypothetical protein